jgi:hypothetical protein
MKIDWAVDGADGILIRVDAVDYYVHEAKKVLPDEVWMLYTSTEIGGDIIRLTIPEDCMPEGLAECLADEYLSVAKDAIKYPFIFKCGTHATAESQLQAISNWFNKIIVR